MAAAPAVSRYGSRASVEGSAAATAAAAVKGEEATGRLSPSPASALSPTRTAAVTASPSSSFGSSSTSRPVELASLNRHRVGPEDGLRSRRKPLAAAQGGSAACIQSQPCAVGVSHSSTAVILQQVVYGNSDQDGSVDAVGAEANLVEEEAVANGGDNILAGHGRRRLAPRADGPSLCRSNSPHARLPHPPRACSSSHVDSLSVSTTTASTAATPNALVFARFPGDEAVGAVGRGAKKAGGRSPSRSLCVRRTLDDAMRCACHTRALLALTFSQQSTEISLPVRACALARFARSSHVLFPQQCHLCSHLSTLCWR